MPSFSSFRIALLQKKVKQYDQFIFLGKAAFITAFSQLLIQGLGLLCGFIIIRTLPPSEYALYTLANTMLGALLLLADGGISSGVLALGGPVWDDKQKLGIVYKTAIQLRKKFAIFSAIATYPFLLYLLYKHEASLGKSIILCLSILPAFIYGITGAILEIIPRLHQKIVLLQRIEVESNVIRLATTAFCLLISPQAFIAISIAGVARFYSNKRITKKISNFINLSCEASPAIKEQIIFIVKRILPTSAYVCVSSQISVWLISLFGSTNSVAAVGALSRIGMLFAVFVNLASIVIIPRFARISKESIRKINFIFFTTIILFSLLLIIFNIIAWIWPMLLLSLLGKNYEYLNIALRWAIATSSVGALNNIANQLSNSRGIVAKPIFFVTFAILTQAVSLLCYDLSTIAGVYAASITSNAFLLSFRVLYFIIVCHKNSRTINTITNGI